MPNWCEGTLKVRGKLENVQRWCNENIKVYNCHFNQDDNNWENVLDTEAVKIKIDDEEIDIKVCDDAYIKGTRRHFVQEGSYYGSEHNGIMRLTLNIKAAWCFEYEPFLEMAKEYGVDFRFYGFECGMEFNQEVIIENGKLVADNEITYDDYFWGCPFPNLGG